MAKEKNLLISFFIFVVFCTGAFAGTVCTSFNGKRICGNSLVMDSADNSFRGCNQASEKCKRLVVTNSHLASGAKVEVCDDQWKCSAVEPKSMLNDVVNDIAVFELPKSSLNIPSNGQIVREPSGVVNLYSYQKHDKDKTKDVYSGKDLVLKMSSNREGIISTPWMKDDLKATVEKDVWKTKDLNNVHFIVSRGMSGSPVVEIFNDFGYGSMAEINGIIANHHNFLPISGIVKTDKITRLSEQYIQGQRGLDKNSEKLKGRWHYSSDGNLTYRSLLDGKLFETGVMSSLSGGSVVTDSGGSVVTDSGGPVVTDSGGSVVTDSGGSVVTDSAEFCGPETQNSKLLSALKRNFRLYPGVIIDDKKVIGFKEKESGRIVHANWDILTLEDVVTGKYEKYSPYFQDEFSPGKLLESNRKSLVKRKTERFCLKESRDCFDIKLQKNKLSISVDELNETVIDLEKIEVDELFKNVPLSFPSGKKTSLWLPDLFLPDSNLDPLRSSTDALAGGNHESGTLEFFQKVK